MMRTLAIPATPRKAASSTDRRAASVSSQLFTILISLLIVASSVPSATAIPGVTHAMDEVTGLDTDLDGIADHAEVADALTDLSSGGVLVSTDIQQSLANNCGAFTLLAGFDPAGIPECTNTFTAITASDIAYNLGWVGINTGVPSRMLHIAGDVGSNGTIYADRYCIGTSCVMDFTGMGGSSFGITADDMGSGTIDGGETLTVSGGDGIVSTIPGDNEINVAFDCTDVTDSANDGIACTGSDLSVTLGDTVDAAELDAPGGPIGGRILGYDGANLQWVIDQTGGGGGGMVDLDIAGDVGGGKIDDTEQLQVKGESGGGITTTYTEAASTLTVGIDTAGAGVGQALKYDGANVVWQNDAVDDADADPANELQNLFSTVSVGGTSLDADLQADTLTVSGGGIVTVSGVAGTDTMTISATEVDGSTTNELQNLFYRVAAGGTNLDAEIQADTLTVSGGGIVTVTGVAGTDTMTISATEVDGSTTNEIQNVIASGGLRRDASNDFGLVNSCTQNQVLKAGAVAGQWACGDDLTSGSPTFDLIGAGTNTNALVIGTGGSLSTSGTGTIAATTAGALAANGGNCGVGQYARGVSATGAAEDCTTDAVNDADADPANELQNLFYRVAAGGTNLDADMQADTLTVSGGGIVTVTGVAGTDTMTISATEVDGSTTNEIQNVIASGGLRRDASNDFGLVNSCAQNQVLKAGAVAGQWACGDDISSGASSFTLTGADGGSQVIDAGNIMTLDGGTGVSVVVSATDTATISVADTSATNELQNLFYRVAAGGTNLDAEIQADTLTVSGGGIVTVTGAAGTDTMTISATEVDGSTTNEIQDLGTSGAVPNVALTITGSAGTVSCQTLTGSSALCDGGDAVNDADADPLNELQNLFSSVSAGGTSLDADLQADTLTVSGGGIVTVSGVAGTDTMTISATEVDGSTTNELQNVITGGGLVRDASYNFGIEVCPAGQIMKSDGTNWDCQNDNYVDGDSSSTNEIQNIIAGSGLYRDASNNFGLSQACTNGQVLRATSTAGQYTCSGAMNYFTIDGAVPSVQQQIDNGEEIYFQGAGGISVVTQATNTVTISYTSSRTIKEDIHDVDRASILAKVLTLPIYQYKYIGREETGIGPVAEEFKEIFNIGENEKYLNPLSLGGVAVAAIQEQQKHIESLEDRQSTIDFAAFEPPKESCDSDDEGGKVLASSHEGGRLYICMGTLGWKYLEMRS